MIEKKFNTVKYLNFFKENAKFHHIGLAVKSIKSLIPGIKPIRDPIQKVLVAFISLEKTTIELLEPISKNSPVYNNLKNNNKLCHICFEVSNLKKAIENAKKKGFHVIKKPVPAVALGNREVCFLYHPDYYIVELLQR